MLRIRLVATDAVSGQLSASLLYTVSALSNPHSLEGEIVPGYKASWNLGHKLSTPKKVCLAGSSLVL